MKIALLQYNATVGALATNAERLATGYREACAAGADIVVSPELFITGYPPEDLLLLPAFVADAEQTVATLARNIGKTPLIVGAPWRDGKHLKNAAWVLRDGAIETITAKCKLPNYGPFDEHRYFTPHKTPACIDVAGHRIGLSICEDLWQARGPHRKLAALGADFILNLSASPYHHNKQALRREVFATRARECKRPIVVCNLVGGQDELVFDGHSFAMGADGQCVAQAAGFAEQLVLLEWHRDGHLTGPAAPASSDEPAETAAAIELGLRDYVTKNGFHEVLVGMSGGIDSALTGALAVRALGAGRVHAVSMPSRYNSPGTRDDAREICRRLDIDFREISIEPVFQATLDALETHLGDPSQWGVTAENMQSRTRGQYLMSLSNRHNWLVLATGNKSELAMGYATLYGDMVGGFAPIKDLTKTRVYALTQWLIDHEKMPIPQSIIDRPPSAELKENQTDQDSLPEYDVLDRILEAYIEDNMDIATITARGDDEALVRRVLQAVDRNEYKRRQAAPGPRVTQRVFGKDRRMPLTQRWNRA